MTEKKPLYVIAVDDDLAVSSKLESDIHEIFGDGLHIKVCQSATEARELIAEIYQNQSLLAIVITDFAMPEVNGLTLLRQLRKEHSKHSAYHLLLSDQASFETVNDALNDKLVDRCLSKPWTKDELYRVLKDLISKFLLTQAFDQVEYYENLVSHSHYRMALQGSEKKRAHLAQDLWSLQQSLIAPGKFTDNELNEKLREELQRLSDEHGFKQVFKSLPKGTSLFQEGDRIGAMYLILSGEVSHFKKDLLESGHEEIFCEGAGSILGSMAHFSKGEAFTSVIAKTDVEIVNLSQDILEKAMADSFSFSIYFTNILLRQVMRRVRLNVSTNVELAQTLEELKAAQVQLVESEKLASLGQLVAGVAHELNNPTAAIVRSVDHLASHISTIINTKKEEQSSILRKTFERGFQLQAITTRDIRQRAKALHEITKDPVKSKLLAEMGFENDKELKALHSQHDDNFIDRLSVYFKAGKFLRNISNCGNRIESLVKSLKNYARPEAQQAEWSDIHQGLEETILLLHHRLKHIELIRDYGELPNIYIWPGEINQIWTNLLTNALDALQDQENPRLEIKTYQENKSIVVTICDNGEGIPKELQEKIFELNFTTKKDGHYGLGLGLAICKKVAKKHYGNIKVRSEIGKFTCFELRLPL